MLPLYSHSFKKRIYNHKKLQYNKKILTNKRGLKRVYSAPLGNVNEFGTPRRLGYEKKKNTCIMMWRWDVQGDKLGFPVSDLKVARKHNKISLIGR